MAGIPLENHHDALCDATACARILLTCMGVEYREHHYEKMTVTGRRKRDLSSDSKNPLADDDIEIRKHLSFIKKSF